MIRVNANLFRIANLSVSTEETRYYLNGVFVEKHASGKGATLTTTDGHRLLSIYDETGICDKPAIVKLSDAALKCCKPHKSDPEGSTRYIVVDQASETATIDVRVGYDCLKHQTVAVSERCIVDGTFPDYRRVVTQCVNPCDGKEMVPSFDQAYVASFCDIALELWVHAGNKRARSGAGSVVITGATRGEAALVSFPHNPIAFGLLMPMRTPAGFKPVLPAWFGQTTQALAA